MATLTNAQHTNANTQTPQTTTNTQHTTHNTSNTSNTQHTTHNSINAQALQRALNARQFGLKLIANVTYGYASASFSGRMPMAELADSIVQVRVGGLRCGVGAQLVVCPSLDLWLESFVSSI